MVSNQNLVALNLSEYHSKLVDFSGIFQNPIVKIPLDFCIVEPHQVEGLFCRSIATSGFGLLLFQHKSGQRRNVKGQFVSLFILINQLTTDVGIEYISCSPILFEIAVE